MVYTVELYCISHKVEKQWVYKEGDMGTITPEKQTSDASFTFGRQ